MIKNKKHKKQVLMIIIAIIILLGVFVWKYWFSVVFILSYPSIFIQEMRSPDITRNLPGDWDEGKVEFNKRVKASYPIGLYEADLISQLKKNGFSVEGKLAKFSRFTGVCKLDWSISWSTNSEGSVKEIEGDYWSACL